MSLLRADRVANRFNNTGPVIVGPSTVHGDFTITGDLIVAGIAVTNSIQIGAALTVRDFTVQQQSTLNNLTVTGVTTVGLVTGSSATYFGDGSGLSGIVTTASGTRGIQVLPNTGANAGKGSITIRAIDVVESGFANVAAGATNLTGGDSGRIPYQINPGETGYSATGNTGEILLSGGTGSPTWSSLAAINVAYADSAGIATDLYGGSGGRLVYQSGIDQTAFVPTGLTGRILMAKGSGTPEWLDARVGLSVSFAKFAGVSTNVTGGIASVTHLSVGENGSGIATFFGPLQAVDINVTGLTTSGNLEVTGIATINQLEVGPRGNTLVGITTILDEDTLASNRDDALATQQSIKTYVDTLVDAQDLDYAGDNGSGSVDLDDQVFNIIGGVNQVYTNVSGQTLTVGFTTDVTIANDLTVTGNAGIGSLNVTGISTLETLGVNGVLTTPFANVTGVATITRLNSTQNEFTDINLTGVATARTLDVTGVTSTANLRVTGISTLNRLEVTGIATFKNDIYLTSGNTFYNANLSNPNLVGVATAQRFEFDVIDGPYANVTGIATIANIQSTQVNVSGVSTFSDNVGIASLNVSGITTLSHLGVTGVTTTENLQVAGITTINDLIVSGVATFTGSLDVSGSIGINSAVLTGVTTISELDVTGDASVTGNAGIGSLNVTGISTLSNVIVTGNAGIGSLNVTGISTLETLGVTGTASAGFLEVTGVSTFSNDVQISQDLSVTGNAGIGSLNVSGISTFSNITVTGNAGIGSLNVTGVSTLGVTTATSLSLNEVIVSGLTTTATLNVGELVPGGGSSTNYASVTLSGQSSPSFNVTYTRQATGFTLDTGTVSSGSAQFNANGSYYYYVASSGPQANGRIIIFSEVDNAWVVLLNIGEDYTEGNVTNNLALGSVTAVETVTATSVTGDGRNVPQSSATIVYPTSGGGGSALSIGATIENYGGAVFAGIITAAGIDVSGGEGGSATFSDITVSGNAGIGSLNVTGISTFSDINVTGNAGIGSLNVTGISTFSNTITTGNAGIGSLNVTGITTLGGFTTITDSLYVSGIASVGTMITMFGNTGVVSATSFYGDGSNLTGVVGLVSVTNILFVTPDGNDDNDGYLVSTAKRTVGAALTIAEASTVVKISAGAYLENNPIILPEQVTLLGDSLREVSIVPQNPDQDLIYVANGSYVENMSFNGALNEGKAIIAFNPNKPSYVTQGPYIRNCTNFISNSIGMKIDGAHVVGDTRAMNVDSYTQLNQGGIGVSISNEGYAQLVSIFTIYNDQSIVCTSGGQCDLTNSNSSFGRLGLVADGIGPTNFIGTITEFQAANQNTFPIDISTETISVSNAAYEKTSGLTTITTHKNHGFEVGMSINLAGLGFTCPPYPHTFSSAVTDAITNTGVSNRFQAQAGTSYDPATGLLVLNIGSGHGQTADSEFTATTGTAYNPSTGILTVVTTGVHGMTTGDYVKIVEGSLRFTCAKDGNATNHDYPRATDPVNNKWKQVVVTNTTTFTMNIGKSSDTSLHTWVSAVANGILRANSLISIADGGVTFTCAQDGDATNHSYPRSTDPASGKIFGVEAIDTATITLNIGKSPSGGTHAFVSGVTDAIVARTKAASYTAVVGTTYDGPTGSLVLDVNTAHGLTAATALTAGSGTTYEPTTGLLTVVTTGAHGMTTGDLVKFDKQSLTFTCTSDGDTAQITYPRTTDPVFNKWKQVTVTNATTFTVFIGATTTGNYPHTWVSATAGGVKKAESLITLTDNSLSFTCTKDGNTVVKSYPAYTDPASCRILGVDAVTSDTITINVGPANLATFPDNFGRIFTVSKINSLTQFETSVGFSTITHGYDSGGNTNNYVIRPYDGQVVYFDSIYNTIKDVTITNGGSGYTQPPQITFSDPSESWGIKATGNAEITNGRVTGVTMISNGRGYTGTPTVTIAGAATGTPDILPTYYVVSSSTPISQGISTVTFTDNVPYALGVGNTVPFFKQSRVLASSQAFEYIGSGNTFPDALPARGGVAIPENEVVNKNGGLVIFTSTDQAGNFKIGEGVIINQLEGSITGDAYNRSLFANITPYILALGGDS